MPAPVASGWSSGRVRVAPTGKHSPCTAHATTGRPGSQEIASRATSLRGSVVVGRRPCAATDSPRAPSTDLRRRPAPKGDRTSAPQGLEETLANRQVGGSSGGSCRPMCACAKRGRSALRFLDCVCRTRSFADGHDDLCGAGGARRSQCHSTQDDSLRLRSCVAADGGMNPAARPNARRGNASRRLSSSSAQHCRGVAGAPASVKRTRRFGHRPPIQVHLVSGCVCMMRPKRGR
jgi:hypothetical protein